uniref:variable large family protein n=1 Tax=Borreliella afzelii TaxID=29518 RepID=UPI00359C3A1B
LRGMAKDGKFAVKDDDGKGAVKSAAESAVTKVLTSISILVQKAIGEGLTKVSEAIKNTGGTGKGEKTATSTASEVGATK